MTVWLVVPWLFLAGCVFLGGVLTVLCPDVDPDSTPKGGDND